MDLIMGNTHLFKDKHDWVLRCLIHCGGAKIAAAWTGLIKNGHIIEMASSLSVILIESEERTLI